MSTSHFILFPMKLLAEKKAVKLAKMVHLGIKIFPEKLFEFFKVQSYNLIIKRHFGQHGVERAEPKLRGQR